VGRMPLKKLQRNSATVVKKKQYRSIQAYIMTNMYPGAYTKALNEMKKIKYVKKISIVTGDYDIVVNVNVKNLGQLHKVTSQINKVNGVEKTNTQVIEKECKSLSCR
jgi:DNA-binding Lrp family transcriptional regulator